MAGTSEILLAGFGGQGILFAGKVLAYGGLLAGCEVSWLPSYGPEMRGGTCNCSVCLSEEPIGSPLVTAPDDLIVMNQPSMEKFAGQVKPGGRIFLDSTMIPQAGGREDVEWTSIPASRLATENSLEGMANIILIGSLMAKTQILTWEEARQALDQCVPPRKAHLLEANLKALKVGMESLEG